MFPPEEGSFLSRIPKEKIRNLGYSQESNEYILELDMFADGVACSVCTLPIVEEVPYYCKRDGIFMHKNCFAHPNISCSRHPGKLSIRDQHKDFPVTVIFAKKSKGLNSSSGSN